MQALKQPPNYLLVTRDGRLWIIDGAGSLRAGENLVVVGLLILKFPDSFLEFLKRPVLELLGLVAHVELILKHVRIKPLVEDLLYKEVLLVF